MRLARRPIHHAVREIQNARRYAGEIRRVASAGAAAPDVMRFARLFQRWRRSLDRPADGTLPPEPWLTFDATDFLRARLSGSMRVFEYGAGASTLFLASRVREGWSVEHDPAWARVVTDALRASGLSSWNVELVEPTLAAAAVADPGDPERYASHDAGAQGRSFQAYARSIERFPAESFDLVLIDGRARPSCFLHSLTRVRAGGWILLDNSEREHYGPVQRHASALGWRRTAFFGPGPGNAYFWETSVWSKPAAGVAGQ